MSPSLRRAREMRGAEEWKPKARRMRSRSLLLANSTRPLLWPWTRHQTPQPRNRSAVSRGSRCMGVRLRLGRLPAPAQKPD
jgi:hypothetical protein